MRVVAQQKLDERRKRKEGAEINALLAEAGTRHRGKRIETAD